MKRLRLARYALVTMAATCALATFTSGAGATDAKGHSYQCSIYRALIEPGSRGDAIITFRNWVAPALPGGAHGEPSYDCVGAAAHLTVANKRSTDEWSTTKPRRFQRLAVACLVHFPWFGEYVTVTVRSVWVDDPVCGYLLNHRGP